MGDLKLVERPQNYTLAPGDTKVIRANIKVRAPGWLAGATASRAAGRGCLRLAGWGFKGWW